MTTTKTDKNTSPEVENTAPAAQIDLLPSQLRCNVQDFIASSKYPSFASADRTIGGEALLSGAAQNNYYSILDQIEIKSLPTGEKVARLNGHDFLQDGNKFNRKTATFPVSELLTALGNPPQPHKLQYLRREGPWLLLATFIWLALILTIVILSGITINSFPLILLSIFTCISLAFFCAVLTNDIRHLYCEKNNCCKFLTKIFSQKVSAGDYSAIRQAILQNQKLIAEPQNGKVRAFINAVSQLNSSSKETPTITAYGLVTVLMSILSEQFGISQSDIKSHLDALNKTKVINGLCSRAADDLFVMAREATLSIMIDDLELRKLRESAKTQKGKNNLRKAILQRLGKKL